MVYIKPNRVLEAIADHLRQEVKTSSEAVDIQEQIDGVTEFLHFLAYLTEYFRPAVLYQRKILIELLMDLQETTTNIEGECLRVQREIAAGFHLLDNLQKDAYGIEEDMILVASNVLQAIEEHTEKEHRRILRKPLYNFIRIRISSQIALVRKKTIFDVDDIPK
jgi:hypothetical protein